jgi:hypothetical protein
VLEQTTKLLLAPTPNSTSEEEQWAKDKKRHKGKGWLVEVA